MLHNSIMSHLLLDDVNAMNGINPFVATNNFLPPGTSKHMLEYQKYKSPDSEETEQAQYKSPACGILSKGVGRPGYRKEKCDLSRPVIPGRNIDRGFTRTELNEIKHENAYVLGEKQGKTCSLDYYKLLLAVILLTLTLLISRR